MKIPEREECVHCDAPDPDWDEAIEARRMEEFNIKQVELPL